MDEQLWALAARSCRVSSVSQARAYTLWHAHQCQACAYAHQHACELLAVLLHRRARRQRTCSAAGLCTAYTPQAHPGSRHAQVAGKLGKREKNHVGSGAAISVGSKASKCSRHIHMQQAHPQAASMPRQ